MLSNMTNDSSGGSSMSSIRSPRTAGAGAGRTRFRKIALVAALAALAASVLAAPAGASLSGVGPVNPRTGFPDWYQDGNGLKLGLCLDGLPVCSAAAGDLVAPDGEAFWWRATADLTSGPIIARMALAQEAAFTPPDPMSFGRIRVTITGATPGATYTVRHPYGSLSITADASGVAKSTTDIGCAAAPCDWAAALGTGIGPFLHWDPTVAPNPQPGYIGDAATPHKVVGSPTGFNAFSVSGTGINQTTDQLTVEGKLAGPPVPDIEVTKAVGFGEAVQGTAVQRTITVQNLGVPDAGGASNLLIGPINIAGPQAPFFQLISNGCTGQALVSGASCQLVVQLNPGATGPYTAALGIVHNSRNGASGITLGGSVISAATAAGRARNSLRARGLRTTHRMSRSRVLRNGLRLSMHLPAQTEILKLSVLRVGRNGKVNRKPVWLGFRV